MIVLASRQIASALVALAIFPAMACAQAIGVRGCFATPDARNLIADHRLITSSTAMNSAATKTQGDALGGKLCRLDEKYVYEITLLRRDGRVIHATVDALTGRIVGMPNIQ